MENMEDIKYVTRIFAASMLGVSTRTLDRLASQGQIARHQKFGRVYFLREDVERLSVPRVVG